MQFAVADEGCGEAFAELGGVGEGFGAGGFVAGAARDCCEILKTYDGQGGGPGEVLLVFLVLLPDGGVFRDDPGLIRAVALRVGEERLDDVVAGALVEWAAPGGSLEQGGVVEFALVLAEDPQRKAPVVEIDVGGASSLKNGSSDPSPK